MNILIHMSLYIYLGVKFLDVKEHGVGGTFKFLIHVAKFRGVNFKR